MTVDQVVRQAILHYPTLFQNRTDVLHHLFYVIGNGHAWENGEIVDTCGSYENHEPHMYDENDPWFGEENKKRNAELQHIRDTIDERVHDLSDLTANKYLKYPGPGVKHWYPESEYSLINKIPADVKPDWAEAAEQIRKLYGT